MDGVAHRAAKGQVDTWRLVVIEILGRMVGMIFVVAAVEKALRPEDILSVGAYFGLPAGLARAMAFVVAVAEAWAGLWLLIAPAHRMGRWVGLALLTVFIWYLIYLARLAHPPSCGCGGLLAVFNSNRTNARFGLFRNVVMAAILLFGEPAVRAWARERWQRFAGRTPARPAPDAGA
jgi:uncharacterized membrane protein YphA (DoxX/SURF4 family)